MLLAQETIRVDVSVANNEVSHMTEERYAQLQAWERAVSKECGMEITTSTFSVGFEYLSEIVNFNVRGLIISSELVDSSTPTDTVIDGKSVKVFDYTYEIIFECKEYSQPDFNVRIQGDEVYNHNEPLNFQVIPTQEVYLYIFGLDEEGIITLLYPAYFYPREQFQEKFTNDDPLQTPFLPGLTYRVQNNTDKQIIEAIVAVATESPWPLKGVHLKPDQIRESDQTLSLDDYNEWLMQIPMVKRAIDWKQITIARNH
jgi:hypothetical protein